ASEPFGIAFVGWTFPRTTARTTTGPGTMTKLLERTLSVSPETMHDVSPSRGAVRTRRGIAAWAQCLTLISHCNPKGQAIKFHHREDPKGAPCRPCSRRPRSCRRARRRDTELPLGVLEDIGVPCRWPRPTG